MLLSHVPVKATRKDHQCHGCLDMIPVGSPARKDAGVTWGDFWSIVWCAACLDWLKAHPSFWDEREDGCMPGDVAEERRRRAGTAEDGTDGQ